MNEQRTVNIARQLLFNLTENAFGWRDAERANEKIFSDERDRIVFREILSVINSVEFFDSPSVNSCLFENEDAFDYFEREIRPAVNTCDSNTNNKIYIAKLISARARELDIRFHEQMIEIAKNDAAGAEAREALERQYEENIAALTVNERPIESAASLADEYIEYLSNRRKFLPTQFSKMNAVMYGGFSGGQLICVGARPSRGKTEVLNQIAEHHSENGYHVMYFSLEMNKFEMMSRMMLSRGGIDSRELVDFNVDKASPAFQARYNKISQNEFYHPIDDVRNASDILAKVRAYKKKGFCDIVYIDYLGLCASENKGAKQRYLEIAEMTHAFKNLAQTLNIPIVIAHQLNRAADDEHIPNMSDLRESGDIEQDADIVLLIQSPSFSPSAGELWNDHIRLCLAKHRNGERLNFHIKHNGALKDLRDENDDYINDQLKSQFI